MRKRAIFAALLLLICGCGCAPKTDGETTGSARTEALSAQESADPVTSGSETDPETGEETENGDAQEAGEVYTASGKGAVGKITVTLVVADGQVVDCVIDASKESPDKGGVVAEKFQEAFLNGTPVDELDAIAGASVSSATIKQLLRKCLEEAGITQ